MLRNSFNLGRVAALLALGSAGPALVAQAQSGAVIVTVKDATGKPLANATVTLKSDKLQGTRSGVTDAQGVFRAPLLPPGDYIGTIRLDGYKTSSLTANVPLGGSTSAEATLRQSDTAEAVVVVTSTQSKVDKSEVAVTERYNSEDIKKLPLGGSLAGITQLAPGITTGAGGRTAIGGSATYENKFLVNGADINDNYFNTDVGLFIEDAIDQTQVLTNGVSAEYGRFTGGVINAITKRGGNTFDGSLRAAATNQNWNAVLPSISASPGIAANDVRAKLVNKINTTYSVTIGGPIIKDKLWFFFAGRSVKRETSNSLPVSGFQYVTKSEETRYEGNLSWQVSDNHRILASYLSREATFTNRAPLVANTADPAGLSNRKDPLSLTTLSYDGILSSNMNLNVMFTQKKQRITSSSPGRPGNNGGKAFWQSPVFDPFGLLFNNHYFGTDPEDRDNQSIKAVLNMYLTGAGTHHLKIGGEQFKEINDSANKQSPTGYNIDASNVDYSNVNSIKYDFDPADAYLEDWTLAPGGKFTSTYTSFFVNDNWSLNNHWNFTLGARLEKWEGSQGNKLYAKPSFQDITPRIGINYDPSGDGVWQYNFTYATYAGKANAAIVTAGTYVGNPAAYYYGYVGPIVTGVTPSPTTPGFRRSDYDTIPFYVSDATLNTRLSKNFKAPLTIEYTWGMKHKISDNSNFTLLYIYRNQTRMFEDYIGDKGSVMIAGTPFSIIEWGNVTSQEASRVYRALQGTYEVTTDLYGGRLSARGNFTFSKLEGNYEGDGGNSPGGGTAIGNYTRAQPNSAATAHGRLANDEPVRLKTQILWNRPIGNNALALGFNFDYASGKPYSLTRNANVLTTDPVYVDAPGNVYTRFYGRRGSGRFNDTYALDFSVQWDGKIGPATGATSRLGYFIKLTAFNALNNIQQATWDTRGAAPRVTPGTANDVFTARSSFGKANTPANYVGNRQMGLDIGFKF